MDSVAIPSKSNMLSNRKGEMMKINKWVVIGAASCAAAALTVWAVATPSKTFRTTARLAGVTQGTDPVTQLPQFDGVFLNGHNLVNLAMGRPIGDTKKSR